MNIHFAELIKPDPAVADILTRWANDPYLAPRIRPHPNRAALEKPVLITAQDLQHRLENQSIFLIYLGDRLVGEMNYQVDPEQLLKKVPGTAWIGIQIGEPQARGKGLGPRSMHYLEEQIQDRGLRRIELGVFEFNKPAQKLYRSLGYQEFARLPDFTFWRGKMWEDIRMEKYFAQNTRGPR